MEFPKFTDFLATLDNETIAGIIKDGNNAAKIAAEAPDILDESRLGLENHSAAFLVSLALLATYHKWLERQF